MFCARNLGLLSTEITPHCWSEEETNRFISAVKDMNIMSFVEGRKHRDSEIDKKVSEKLGEARFVLVVLYCTGGEPVPAPNEGDRYRRAAAAVVVILDTGRRCGNERALRHDVLRALLF